jgi:membrane fusion protein, multidrug efflux system
VQIAKSIWRCVNSFSRFLSIAAVLTANTSLLSAEPRTAAGNTRSSAARGIVHAVEQASISTELATRVAAVHFKEGDTFQKGSTIVEFDCRRQRAALAATEAQQLEMQLTLDKYRLLQRAQSVGKNDLEVAEARLAKAVAESAGLRSTLDQCTVIAPFDGRIIESNLQRYETAQPGKPFLAIASTDNPEIDLIVPSSWARWLEPGLPFQFLVDELNVMFDAEVTRTGAAVDPISQTIKIAAIFKRPVPGVLPGMSGTAHFADEKR